MTERHDTESNAHAENKSIPQKEQMYQIDKQERG